MGFGGGGSGALPAHQHTNVPLSGGPLDMSNVTVGSLTAGSVVYSNGAALQELVKPAVPAGEVLSYPALAVAPVWGAAGGGATLTRATYSTSTTQTVSSLTMVDLTGFTHTAQAGAGMVICNYISSKIVGGQNGSMRWDFATDGAQPNLFVNDNYEQLVSCYGITQTLSSQVCKMQGMVNGAGSIDFQGDSKLGIAYWLEIS